MPAARTIGLAFAGSLLIAACAQASIPLWPVPVTLQTFAVALIAGSMGRRVGVGAVMFYLAEGLAGLPVFANGAWGFARLAGPTGGYLVAFLVSAAVTGTLIDRRRGALTGATRAFGRAWGAMLVGDACVLAIGALWLTALTGGGDPLRTLVAGSLPFVPGAIVKSGAAAAIATGVRRGRSLR